LQYGGANTDWVEASGGTYNLVEKIDMIISTIQGQLPTEIIFTTTSTDPPNVSWTVPASVKSVTIEASSAGALGTPAIATSKSSVYQGRDGGGSRQIGNITVPVAEGMVLTISLGAVLPPGNSILLLMGLHWRSMASLLSLVMGQVATLVGWMEAMGPH